MDINALKQTINELLKAGYLRKMIFANSGDKNYLRGEAVPVKNNDTLVWRLTCYMADGKAIHENYQENDMADKVIDLTSVFSQFHLHAIEGQFDCRISKKGKILVCDKIKRTTKAQAMEHNRAKQYILDSYKCRSFLSALGVSDENGRVFEKKMSKFRQINKFLEIVRDIYADLPKDGELFICDLCCGKSYLTFAVYYYLTELMGRKVVIYGVDRKEDVISFCDDLSKKLGFDGMNFIAGDILNFEIPKKPDMVISLHACDIATDIVLAAACKYEAKVILSTPCCHHEMFAQSKKNSPTELSFVMEHSILRQKFCTAATDALRALRLEAQGYAVDAFELIDPEETPKNVILRAVYQNTHGIKRQKALERYHAACSFLGVELTLDKLLTKEGQEAQNGDLLALL